MKRCINLYSFILACFFLLLACDPIIDVPLPEHESRLVVNAYLIEGQEILVDVSKSVGILDEDEPSLRLVKDATVQIIENDQVLNTPAFTDSMPNVFNPDWGMYKGNFNPTAGSLYEVKVSHPELGGSFRANPNPCKTRYFEYSLRARCRTR